MQKRLLFIISFSLLLISANGQEFGSLSSNDAIANQNIISANFSLSEAYPNPANSETKFDYNLPKSVKEVKIIIRSLLGFVVSEHLIEGTIGTLTIQTNDLTGGFYFYSLIINGDIKITRKLIVKH